MEREGQTRTPPHQRSVFSAGEREDVDCSWRSSKCSFSSVNVGGRSGGGGGSRHNREKQICCYSLRDADHRSDSASAVLVIV